MKIVPLSPPGMSETVLVSTVRHRKKFSFPFFMQLFEALCLDLGQLSYPHLLKEVVLSVAIFFFFLNSDLEEVRNSKWKYRLSESCLTTNSHVKLPQKEKFSFCNVTDVL